MKHLPGYMQLVVPFLQFFYDPVAVEIVIRPEVFPENMSRSWTYAVMKWT